MSEDSRPFALVLGARVAADGRPSPALRRRAELAVRLWQDGAVRGVLASGGGKRGPAEAEVVRALLIEAGLPEQVILTESRSRTTWENLAMAARTLPPGASVVIVTDWWHMPRARLAARSHGVTAAGAAVGLRGARALPQLRALGREAPALALYLWRALRHRRH